MIAEPLDQTREESLDLGGRAVARRFDDRCRNGREFGRRRRRGTDDDGLTAVTEGGHALRGRVLHGERLEEVQEPGHLGAPGKLALARAADEVGRIAFEDEPARQLVGTRRPVGHRLLQAAHNHRARRFKVGRVAERAAPFQAFHQASPCFPLVARAQREAKVTRFERLGHRRTEAHLDVVAAVVAADEVGGQRHGLSARVGARLACVHTGVRMQSCRTPG